MPYLHAMLTARREEEARSREAPGEVPRREGSAGGDIVRHSVLVGFGEALPQRNGCADDAERGECGDEGLRDHGATFSGSAGAVAAVRNASHS